MNNDIKLLRMRSIIQMPRIQVFELVAAFLLLVFFLLNISNSIQDALTKTGGNLYLIMHILLPIGGLCTWLFLFYRHIKKQIALKELFSRMQGFCDLVLNMNTASDTSQDGRPNINSFDISDCSITKKMLAEIEQSEKYYKTLINYKEQVQQERDFYTHILSETPSLVVWLNPDGTIKYCNPALSRSTGYSIQELLGKKWWDVFYADGKDDAQIMKLNEASAFGRKGIRDYIMTLRAKNGENRYISWTTANIFDENGRPKELIGLGNDITEERSRAAHESEEQKMKALASMAGGLAHEISNSLQPILGISEICSVNYSSKDKKLAECMQIIMRNALHCRNIVNGVLSFARRETKKKQIYNLGEVLEESLSFTDEFLPMEVQVSCKGFGDDFDATREEILVNINRTELVQVMANLFTNASHAMKRCGIIEVALDKLKVEENRGAIDNLSPGEYAVISVKDNGYGMNEEVQKSLFQPFFTTKSVGEGTGLGLAAVYGIISDWSGTIKVQSKVGEGSTFFLYIPIVIEKKLIPSTYEISEREGLNENGKHTRH